MNKLQTRQYKMSLEVDRICKKYNLKYSLDGGTLLGAIRHKGFIPWDDDLDITMPRKDYDKFIQVAQEEFKDKYFLQTAKTDKNYGLIFAKVRENNTIYKEEMAKNVDIHHGIFIDIFPIDNTADDIKVANKIFKKIIFLRMLLLIKCKYIIDNSTLIKKIEILILKIMSLFISRKSIIKMIEKYSNKYNNENTKNVAVYGTIFFDKGIFSKDLFEEYIDVDFEGSKLSGFKKYDEYLTLLYGDYMTPPPVSERDNRHGIIEIKLDKKDE